MIDNFVESWNKNKDQVREYLTKNTPRYEELFTEVVKILEDDWESPDHERITKIDHGHYQGTLVFVVACEGYQPSTYWYLRVYYGSCSGCDTVEHIRMMNYSYDEDPTEEQIEAYMRLALQMVQGLKKMDEEAV